jgi:hypothetical protein
MPDVRLQSLTGAQVRDVDGKVVGRIGEIHAERIGAQCHVVCFDLGPAAFLSRLGISARRLVGWAARGPLRVPWQQMDLSDPERPRLRCRIAELKRSLPDVSSRA